MENLKKNVIFEFVTVVLMKIQVLWLIKPCQSDSEQSLKGVYCHLLLSQAVEEELLNCVTLKMVALCHLTASWHGTTSQKTWIFKAVTLTGSEALLQPLADQLFQMCKCRAHGPHNLVLEHLAGWLKQNPRVSSNFSHCLPLVALLPAGIVPQRCLGSW